MTDQDQADLAEQVSSGDSDDPAELLRGRYEPLEVLGHGGQGQVIRAWDHQHGRAVALKVRRVGPSRGPDRVPEEARLLLAVRPHQNIAIARDDFFEGEDHYLVLDWVAGVDLRAQLRRHGDPGLPYDQVVEALQDVAAALDHLHGHEPPVIHGDVKPANIVVSNRPGDAGRAVLVDFGLAGAAEGQASLGATEAYASPEVYRGEAATAASDIYSLAATAFELMTGRVPVPGATLDWSGVPPEAMDAVRNGLARGLASDAADRPTSAGALIASLGAGPPASRRERRRRARATPAGRARRNRRRVVLGVLVTVAVAVAGTVVWAKRDTGPEELPFTGPAAFPPEELPVGATRIGRVGLYDPRSEVDDGRGGQIETFDLAADGTSALHGGLLGQTQTWTAMTQLTPGTFVFYREVDQFTVVCTWNDDGSLSGAFTPSEFGGGWNHLQRIGPGQLLSYDDRTGRAQLSAFGDDGNITEQVPVPGLRPGFSVVSAVADGRALFYDDRTGEAEVRTFAPDGSSTSEGALNLGRSWDTAVQVQPGILVFGDSTLGRLRPIDLSKPGTSLALDESIGRTWTSAVSPAEGYFLVYRREDGASRQYHMQVTQLVRDNDVELPAGATKLIARP